MGIRRAILGAMLGLLCLGPCHAAAPAADGGPHAALHAALTPASAAEQGLHSAAGVPPIHRDQQLSSVASWIAPDQPAGLWSVLVAGVLIVAAVAWSLLRQPRSRPSKK